MKKIILLEDEKALGTIYKKHLETAGYKVSWAQHTDEFMELNEDKKLDLIVMDYGIKGGENTGLDILPAIRKEHPDAKIIVLSNFSKFQLEEKCLKAGADAYLVKIDTPPKVLLAYIKKLLGGKG